MIRSSHILTYLREIKGMSETISELKNNSNALLLFIQGDLTHFRPIFQLWINQVVGFCYQNV